MKITIYNRYYFMNNIDLLFLNYELGVGINFLT